jgi:3-dehydroquinate synthase
MKIAARLAQELGLISDALVQRHAHLLDRKLGLNAKIPDSVTVDALLDVMTHDNKKTSKDVRFVLLAREGECHNPEGDYLVTVDPALVRRVVTEFFSSQGR